MPNGDIFCYAPRSVAFHVLHNPPFPRNVGTPDSADTPAPTAMQSDLIRLLVCLQVVQDRQKHQTSHDKDCYVRT